MADTASLIRDVIAELNAEFFEREDYIEVLWLSFLAGEHVLAVGPPGTGKSALSRAACDRIDGASYWEILMDRMLGKEEMFGPVDVLEYKQTGNWHRKVDGYLPTAHIAFIDEVGKVGATISNQLLAIMQERIYHGNSKPLTVPLITCVGASNEFLEDPEQQAYKDRWLSTVVVDYIQSHGTFATYLTGALTATNRTTVPLADLEQARTVDVPAVTVPQTLVATIMDLRKDLKDEGIEPSDRTWKKAMSLVRAKAYMEGRPEVDESDLLSLRHALPDTPEQRDMVGRKLNKLTNPYIEDVETVKAALIKVNNALDTTPKEELSNSATNINTELNAAESKLAETLKRAKADGRNVTQIQALEQQVKETKARVMIDCLGMPADMVRKIVLGEA